MAISVACSCGKTLKVKDDLAGKRVRCPHCESSLHVPYRLEGAEEGGGASSPSGAGEQLPPKKDPVVRRELTRLLNLHKAVEAAGKRSDSDQDPLAVGCGAGCLAFLAAGTVFGSLLGSKVPRPIGAGLTVLALVGTSVLVTLLVSRRRRNKFAEQTEAAREGLGRAIGQIKKRYPQVVKAVGGASGLQEVSAIRKVLEPAAPSTKAQRSGYVQDALQGILGGNLDGANSVAGRRSGATSGGTCPAGYMEVPRPAGDGLCSDDACPCGHPGAHIPRGQGYLYISQDVVELRRDYPSVAEIRARIAAVESVFGAMMIVGGSGAFAPVLVCELGARKRGLDLETAAADARHWWKTDLAPLRPTPLA